jgi:hypothetical protein
MTTTKNEGYKKISHYAQSHVSNHLRIGDGSSRKIRPDWLMILLRFIIQLLTALLAVLTKRKNRLNP